MIRVSVALLLVFLQTTAAADAVYHLPELYELAVENDMQLKAARQSFEATQLNHPIARADLLPQLDLSFSKRRHLNQKITGQIFGLDDSESGSPFDYYSQDFRLDLKQTLFSWQQFIELRQSKSEVQAAELRYRATYQDMILRLAKAYFDILSSESRLQFARSEKEAYDRQLKQANKRFELGLTSITDAKEAQAAYDLALFNEIDATNELHNNRYALTVIVGTDIKHLAALDRNFIAEMPDPDDISYWTSTALKNNLELLAKQIDVNIADKEVDRNRAGHLPEINLFLSNTHSDTRGGPSPRDIDDRQIGVELNLPLFAGGKAFYATSQAAKEYSRVNYEMRHLQQTVKLDTRTAYLNTLANISRIKALERALESAQAAVEANEAGFNVGTRTSVDVLTVLKDLYEARYEHHLAQYSYIVNLLELKKLVGALTNKDLLAVNQWLTQDP